MRWTARRGFLAVAAALAAAIVTSALLHVVSGGNAPVPPPAAMTSSSALDDPVNGVTDAQLAAFRAASPKANVTTAQLTVGTLTRQYLVIAPAAAHAALPLIITLAGSDASVVTEAERDQLVPLAQQGQAILVYPSSYTADLTWNAVTDGCCEQAGASKIDDSAFLTQLVPAMKAAYAPTAVDLVGFSNGGKLANTLMCSSPQLFNAVAVVAAVPLTSCSGSAVAMLVAIGSSDPREPLVTAVSPLSATTQLQNAAAYWRQRDGCSAASSTQTIGVATAVTWSDCSAGTQVVQVLYDGIGHVWPRSNDVGGPSAAATLIWSFLSSRA
jgi:poly(3-hydroxybutyrate) depolymerase